jgi:cobyrinic acid a,c-diamide synthase
MSKLLDSSELREPLATLLAEELPVLGTCAGMILLADDVLDGRPDQRSLGALPLSVRRNAFGRQIDSFETLGTGTQRGGTPPKTIVDDGEWHTVVFTILDSNAEAKIYWRSPDGPQTMIIHGRSVKAFQTAREFRIEALGDANRSFKYGYVQFRLKNKGGV